MTRLVISLELVHRDHRDSNTQHDQVYTSLFILKWHLFPDIYFLESEGSMDAGAHIFIFYRFIINLNSVILSLLDNMSLDNGTLVDLGIC
jgi:hypothetical protein